MLEKLSNAPSNTLSAPSKNASTEVDWSLSTWAVVLAILKPVSGKPRPVVLIVIEELVVTFEIWNVRPFKKDALASVNLPAIWIVSPAVRPEVFAKLTVKVF